MSNFGRVKSLKRIYQQENGYGIFKHTYKERILKCIVHKQGYLSVRLSKNCKSVLKMVHRLVAQAFLNNYNDNLEVNHIDANKDNNKINNLEMCTRLENQRHAEKNHLIKRRSGKDNKMSKSILLLDDKNRLLKRYNTLTEASIDLNIKIATASYYALGKCKKPKYNLQYERK